LNSTRSSGTGCGWPIMMPLRPGAAVPAAKARGGARGFEPTVQACAGHGSAAAWQTLGSERVVLTNTRPRVSAHHVARWPWPLFARYG
jgi:hypothetical protein